MATCEEFTKLVQYDPWVVPHQLLPAITTLIGIEWNLVLLIMYAWETLEVVFLNCLKISEEELVENALISDPIQALMGILVAKILMNVSGMKSPLTAGVSVFFWGALFIIPGTPIIFGDDYVWFYLPIFFVALFLLHRFGYTLPPTMMVLFVIYTTLTSSLVFGLKDTFNSFYTGLATGSFMIFFALVVKTITDY
jgi:hypothetical protein